MLSDKSKDFEETWKFLDRRLEDALAVNQVPGEIERIFGFGMNAVQNVVSSGLGAFIKESTRSTSRK